MRKLLGLAMSVTMLLVLAGCFVTEEQQNEITTARAPGHEQETQHVRDVAVQVAAGGAHSMALHADGSVWTWGGNCFGQLGNGSITIYRDHVHIDEDHSQHSPIRVMENAVYIAAGSDSSFAINADGELFAWGSNQRGELGDGTRENRLTPVKIMDDVVFVESGWYTTVAITSDGRLWTWGIDITQLGWDVYSLTPAHVMDNVAVAALGNWHMMMLTNDGRLYGMGSARYMGEVFSDPNAIYRTPRFIKADVRSVVVSGQAVFALTVEDRLYSWGPSRDSGVDTTAFWVYIPTLVLDDVQEVFPGSMALRNDDSLWIWGEVSGSFTGPWGGSVLDVIVEYGTPQQLMENVLTAHGNMTRHRLLITRDFYLYAWGDNQFGQLGTGHANVFELIAPEDDYDFYHYELIDDHNETAPVRIGRVG
ncbi:MAG: hypothetical protein FWE40_06575 [Oscillospiraceae bacterium]|nr:hypothetical protein [Oscillospiraceae bacterium]